MHERTKIKNCYSGHVFDTVSLKQIRLICVFPGYNSSKDTTVVTDFSWSPEPSLGLEITLVATRDDRSRIVREEEIDFISFSVN